MADLIGQQFGQYHLLRHIGEGSFADVYLGEHQHLEITAAVKVLHMHLESRVQDAFRREARTIAHLQHAHIVRILDFGFQGQTPYLVMEYAPRGTLRTLHPKGTRIAPEQVVRYLKQIASALDFAHEQGVIHRDIKPENLLLNAKGEAILSDFGIAVVQHTLVSLSEHSFAGTPLYAAPEQIQHHPCPASDQYAAAIMVYEWLCGELPFRGPMYQVLEHHLYQDPPSLCARMPELPAAVDDVLFGALAKDPARRFLSVQEFAAVLEEACFATKLIPVQRAGDGMSLQPVQPVQHAPRTPQAPRAQFQIAPERNVVYQPPGASIAERGVVARPQPGVVSGPQTPLPQPGVASEPQTPLPQQPVYPNPTAPTTAPNRFMVQQFQESAAPSSIFQRNRRVLLRRVRSFWIDGVLTHSLHGAALLAPELAMQPAMLTQRWGLALQHFAVAPRMLPPGTNILQVYEQVGGELLVLGAPGSGKTTLLLELARDLLYRAERDERQPVPVVFNLSSWALKQQALDRWLVDELVHKYQIPRKLGQMFVATGSILPLLDGLDEVAAKERAACIQAINTYRWDNNVSLVVCCRSADYLEEETRIQIDSAVVVQPLTPRQVMSYLSSAGPQLAALYAALQRDPDLQMLATTPLMLNILILAYREMPLSQIAPLGSLPDKQRQIFETYVQRMLQHPDSKRRHYSPERTKQRLSWLARQLTRRSQSVFYIEHIQPDWLPDRFLRWLYAVLAVKAVDGFIGLLVGILGPFLITGFVYGVSAFIYASLGLVIGLLTGKGDRRALDKPPAHGWLKYVKIGPALMGMVLVPLAGYFAPLSLGARTLHELGKGAALGTVIGLVIGVLVCLRASSVQPVEIVAWSWRRFTQVKHLFVGVLVGLGVGLLDWWFFLHLYVLLYAFFCALGSWLVSGLLSGFSNELLDDRQRIVPNQGIRRSTRNGLRLGCLAGLSSGLIYALALRLIYEALPIGIDVSARSIVYGTISVLGIGLLIWLFSGGDAVIKHRFLRCCLWLVDLIPWRFARFLAYAEKCTLLYRAGGGYIFTHRLLLDYFASLDHTRPRN